MAYSIYEAEKELDDSPYENISDRQPLSAEGDAQTVSELTKQTIAKKLGYQLGDAEIMDAARADAKDKQFNANMGQAFQSFSRGSGTPQSNDALYANLNKQAVSSVDEAEDIIKRRQAVRDAIANKEFAKEKFEYQKAKDIEERNFKKQMIGVKADENRNIREERAASKQTVIDEKKAKEAKLSERQVDAITDLDTANSDLESLKEMLGKKSNYTGPVDALVPNFLVSGDEVAFRSAVGKYKDQYRKAITGAGAGPKEIAILETRLPSESDTYENFLAKATEANKELARHKRILLSNLSKQGKQVDQFQSPAEVAYQDKKSSGLMNDAVAAPPKGPKVGTIEDGHRFIGGDASKPENWEKI